MMNYFLPNALYYTDGYKIGHKKMLAKNTSLLYGTWIPRSLKYAPSKSIKKIVSFGQQFVAKRLNDIWVTCFFERSIDEAVKFGKDMSLYLGLPFEAHHFMDLHQLGYLPYRIKALPEGTRTGVNIPHMTLCNTLVDPNDSKSFTDANKQFAWLTLYLETFISSLAWKLTTNSTIAYEFRKNALIWTKKTDKDNVGLDKFMAHDFSARGLSESDMITSGLAHATCNWGSDSIITIPSSRYYYGVGEDEMPIFSVNASEHSVSTTKIFTTGEKQMLIDWLKEFDKGILSVVSDTFDYFKLLDVYVRDLKDLILARDGKLVLRGDSGNPLKIICGEYFPLSEYDTDMVNEDQNKIADSLELEKMLDFKGISKVDTDGVRRYYDFTQNFKNISLNGKVLDELTPKEKGSLEILWDIFGGDVNSQGYRRLDSHVGLIYGDSFTLEKQVMVYDLMSRFGYAVTNLVIGAGSFVYQHNTRDTLGFAAKGSYFEVEVENQLIGYDIYKDPETDDGTKKSLKGLIQVNDDGNQIVAVEQCTWDEEGEGLLQTIFENGKFYNFITLNEIREKLYNEILSEIE